MSIHAKPTPALIRGVNGPGVARQYRVQIRRRGESQWRRHGVYRQAALAEAARAALQDAGIEARVVCYSICAA